MAIRIKNKWHDSERNTANLKSMAEHGSALAFIIWRLALENAKTFHKEGFVYESDRERVGIITELLAFSVQVCDRLAFTRMNDEGRHELVNAVGKALADQMQDNLEEIAGPGNYRPPFIALLNRRLGEYARCGFENDRPTFDFYRMLGRNALEVMGESQANRWIADQTMEITGPELAEQVHKSLNSLLATAPSAG